MSADLEWLLIRKWNSFQVKALPEGPVLSTEPGNLLGISSHKYSGLVNRKSVHIYPTGETGGVSIVTVKKDANPRHVAASKQSTSLKRSSGSRRVAKIAAAETAGKGYRSDLRSAAVARASTLIKVQQNAANPKADKVKVPRGKKAGKKAAVAAENTEDLD